VEAIGDSRPLRAGDILVYEAQGGWIAHRLIAAPRKGKCRVQGDASTIRETIALGDIRGRVVAADRDGAPLDVCSPRGRLTGLWRNRVRRLRQAVGRARK
jgi:hypothetical protein